MKKSAVNKTKHVARHAIPHQREVVIAVYVPMVRYLRQLDEAEGDDDTDDAHHHGWGDTVPRPPSMAKEGFLLPVPLLAIWGDYIVSRAKQVVLVRLSRHWDILGGKHTEKKNMSRSSTDRGSAVMKHTLTGGLL